MVMVIIIIIIIMKYVKHHIAPTKAYCVSCFQIKSWNLTKYLVVMATGTCFLNVDEAVLEWAWQQYDNTASRRQRILRDKDRKNHQKYLRALIDWSDVRCATAFYARQGRYVMPGVCQSDCLFVC